MTDSQTDILPEGKHGFYAKVAAAQRATAEPQSAVVINKYRQRRHRAFEAWCVARRRRSNRPSRREFEPPIDENFKNSVEKR